MNTIQNPLVTVVVPVYNVEKYVKRCLESICAQTYQNMEILLIDDGSTDCSGDICDEFCKRDPRISVVHQKNAGLSAARNKGIEKAKGTYIAFIDSDDYVSTEFINALVTVALNTESDIVQAYVQDVQCETGQSSAPILDKRSTITLSGRDMCAVLLDVTYRDCGVVWNKLYRTTLFRELRFPEGKIHEDDFLISKLYWNAKEVTIYESELYFYQLKRPDSIMNKKYSLKRLDGVEARKEQYAFFARVGDEELCEKAKAEYIRGVIGQIKQLRKSDIENKEEIEKKLRKEAAPVFRACLFGKYLALRTKVGLLAKMLSIFR